MLRRQERHNEGTLTALMSTESLVQQDGCDNHTHEGKPARAYNITQCRRDCLLAHVIFFAKAVVLHWLISSYYLSPFTDYEGKGIQPPKYRQRPEMQVRMTNFVVL